MARKIRFARRNFLRKKVILVWLMVDGGTCGKIRSGSVAEWLKAHDSKSCGPKGLGGSNPLASAMIWIEKPCF